MACQACDDSLSTACSFHTVSDIDFSLDDPPLPRVRAVKVDDHDGFDW